MSLQKSLEVVPSEADVTNTSQSRAQGKVFVVLPSYNEGPNLGPLFASIDARMREGRLSYEVVLVDDGSSDTTPSVLAESERKYPLSVVQHQRNQGLAVTMRDGLLEALHRAEDRDVIVTMDA